MARGGESLEAGKSSTGQHRVADRLGAIGGAEKGGASFEIRLGLVTDGDSVPITAEAHLDAGDAASGDETEIIIHGPLAQKLARLIVAAPDVLAALRIATQHIEHMAIWIAAQKSGYSFESIGEDMPGIRAALSKGSV